MTALLEAEAAGPKLDCAWGRLGSPLYVQVPDPYAEEVSRAAIVGSSLTNCERYKQSAAIHVYISYFLLYQVNIYPPKVVCICISKYRTREYGQ